MASSLSTLLECGICMEDFKESNIPLTLPCTHVYCSACLRVLVRDNRGNIKCPQCRKEQCIEVEKLRICRTTMALREIEHTERKKRETKPQIQRPDHSRADIQGLLASLRASVWQVSRSGEIPMEVINGCQGRRDILERTMETTKQSVERQIDQIIRAATKRKEKLLQILEDEFENNLRLLSDIEENIKAHGRFCSEMAEKETALRGDDQADPEKIDKMIKETRDRNNNFRHNILIPLKKFSADTDDDRYQRILTDVSSWGGITIEDSTHLARPIYPQKQPSVNAMTYYFAKTKATCTIDREKGIELKRPCCVAQLPNGDIAIGSNDNNKINVLDSNLKTNKVVSVSSGKIFRRSRPKGITGICATPNGKLCISRRDTNTVHFVQQNGKQESRFKTCLPPWVNNFYPLGMVSNRAGEVFVCDMTNNVVRVFGQNGQEYRSFGGPGEEPGKLSYPSDVALTPDGRVLVADSGNSRIQVFDGTTGRFQATFGSQGSEVNQLGWPTGIAVDSKGFVAVADEGKNRVQLFTPDWESFHILQNPEDPFGDSLGITITRRNDIVVCDREKNRIQIF